MFSLFDCQNSLPKLINLIWGRTVWVLIKLCWGLLHPMAVSPSSQTSSVCHCVWDSIKVQDLLSSTWKKQDKSVKHSCSPSVLLRSSQRKSGDNVLHFLDRGASKLQINIQTTTTAKPTNITVCVKTLKFSALKHNSNVCPNMHLRTG